MHHIRAMDRPVSRSEMTDALGVSRSKISMEVGRLIETGLLAEDGLAKSEGGRRSSLLLIPRSAGLIAAVDLGATSTDVALTTLGGELLAHRGEPGDIKDGPHSVLDRVKELLSELLAEQGAGAQDVLAIGVGVPGPVEHASGVVRSPPIMPGWDGFPITRGVRRRVRSACLRGQRRERDGAGRAQGRCLAKAKTTCSSSRSARASVAASSRTGICNVAARGVPGT